MASSPRQIVQARVEAWCDQNSSSSVAQTFFSAQDEHARERLADAITTTMWNIAGPHVQEGPSPLIMAKLILGASPRELSGNALTKREAHGWITQSEHEAPKDWLWAQVVGRHPQLSESTTQYIKVMRWVEEVMNDPPRREAALRLREGVIAGHQVAGRPIDRIDEVKPCDIRRSPVDTIEEAGRRIAEEEWDGPDELIPEQEFEKTLPKGVTVLRHYSTLRNEGAEMRHCAVAYALPVHERECIIVSVCAENGARSTGEIRDGKVAQHKGPRNESPKPECVALLQTVRRWA